MTTTIELTKEQVSKLRSLHFWNRNLIVAKREKDTHEITKSRKAIQLIFEDCDRLQIPFSKQNKVLQAAREGVSFCDVSLEDKSKPFSREDFDIMVDGITNNGSWLYNKGLSKGVPVS